MTTAMPDVKPVVTGNGMNLMAAPRRTRPNPTSMMPAMIVAMVRPSTPYCCTTP
jgi:hypothetical protein